MLFNELVLMRLFYFENFFFLMRIAAIPTADKAAINPLVIAIEPPHPPFPSGVIDFGVTVTVAVPVTSLFRVEVAVMVAVPTATPVTTPLATVAMLLLLLVQVTLEEPVSTVTLRAIDCDTAIVGVEGDNVIVFGAVLVDPPNGSASVYGVEGL